MVSTVVTLVAIDGCSELARPVAVVSSFSVVHDAAVMPLLLVSIP